MPKPHLRSILPLLVITFLSLSFGCSRLNPKGEGKANIEKPTLSDASDPSESGKASETLLPDAFPEKKSPWKALTRRMEQAIVKKEIPGGFAIVEIYRKDGKKAYSHSFGKTRSRSQPFAVASASKWVSSTVFLALVDKKILSLDDTTNKWLGWTGDIGKITLRSLLSFTSGAKNHICNYISFTTLKACVGKIGKRGLSTSVGKSFTYGPVHMSVAARMAEIATHKTWTELFQTYIVKPAGLKDSPIYYTIPKKKKGGKNPLVAGGLSISTGDYIRFLTALQGYNGNPLISNILLQEQHKEQWSTSTTIGSSPNKKIHYALGCWRECQTPNRIKTCNAELVVHSAGAFGFIPFIDTQNGYYGVLSAEADSMGDGASTKNLKLFMQELRPLIIKALSGS